MSWSLTWDVPDTRTALIVGVAVILFISWLVRRWPRNIPSGPRGWPVLGYLPKLVLSADPPVTLMEEARRYGEVLSVNLAGQLAVVLSSSRAAKEALSNALISDRPYTHVYDTLVPNCEGVATGSGENCSAQRRFSMSALRGFGFGKTSFEDNIATEADCVIKEMQTYKERPFNPTHLFGNAAANVICSVILGRRFEYSDPRFQEMLAATNRAIELSGTGGTMQFLPIAQKLTFLPRYKELQRCIAVVMKFIREQVETHRQDYDPDNLSDLIDSYLSEIKRLEERGVGKTPINPDNMLVTIFELFVAGTDTSSCSLRWAVVFMMAHPDVQAKVQRELDDVVGRNRLPRLADRPNLPYTEATILEMQRIMLISPCPLPRRASQQTEILGFHIPKDTIVITNLLSVCRDETIWKDPYKFDPGRFVEDGKLLPLREELHIFGFGRRACLGEKLVRMELFIFFSYFLHQFTFKKPDDAPPISFKSTHGLNVAPLPYETCATLRD